jgi:hypothetical protein
LIATPGEPGDPAAVGVVVPIDLRSPFRGSDAVAAGLVTAKALRGPRFRRLFTGIFVGADVEVTSHSVRVPRLF